MTYLVKGSLVEYGGESQDAVTNQVVFQFNPETLTRTIQIPTRPTGSQARETRQAGEEPTEKISLTIFFDASDQLNVDDSTARQYGISHRLAALERMARPPAQSGSNEGRNVDAVGSNVSGSNGSATTPTPRQRYPNVLFTWGERRILPVIIDSMTITEKQFDAQLNPVQAQVALGFSVMPVTPFTEDEVAQGASQHNSLSQNEQVSSHLANGQDVPSNQQTTDLVEF